MHTDPRVTILQRGNEMTSVKNTGVLAFVALMTSWTLSTPVALADDVAMQLVGTWKLTIWVVQVIGEGSREPYGPNPKGRLVLTREGRFSLSRGRIALRPRPLTRRQRCSTL